MTQDQLKIIQEIIDGAQRVKDRFFDFHMNSKMQLSLSQLQFSYSASGIVMALIAIGYQTNYIQPTIWAILAFIFAGLQIVYSISLCREVSDRIIVDLSETKNMLDGKYRDLLRTVEEALRADDFSLFYTYINTEQKIEVGVDNERFLVGEFIVFLFLCTLTFVVMSLIGLDLPLKHEVLILLLIVFLCYFVSFSNWSYRLTKYLSRKRV